MREETARSVLYGAPMTEEIQDAPRMKTTLRVNSLLLLWCTKLKINPALYQSVLDQCLCARAHVRVCARLCVCLSERARASR